MFFYHWKYTKFYSSKFTALNTRYWTTETYDSVYFNDFIFHTLKYDILKRVINNNMTGNSWYFKRFVYLAVKLLDGEVEILVWDDTIYKLWSWTWVGGIRWW